MSIRLFIPTAMFKDKTKGKRVIEVKGDTIRNILSNVIAMYPELKRTLFTREKKLHGYIQVYINDKFVFSDVLEQKVNDGDDIHLSYMMGGG